MFLEAHFMAFLKNWLYYWHDPPSLTQFAGAPALPRESPANPQSAQSIQLGDGLDFEGFQGSKQMTSFRIYIALSLIVVSGKLMFRLGETLIYKPPLSKCGCLWGAL